MSTFAVATKSLPRIDGGVKVTGEAKYAGDMALAQMLYGKILRSPLPHARILHIDTTRAGNLVGVKAVITGSDTSGVKYGVLASAEKLMDRLPLAMDKVRYIGDEVAAVAAVDEDTAEEALSLIRVEYEELPAVFDPQEAMKPEAPRIHDHAEQNISKKQLFNFGDVDAAFQEAYHVREDQFITQVVTHAPLEPHGCLASYDAAGGLTIWTSTQTPFYVMLDLAKTLGLPQGKVRVIKPPVGGGFGGKADGMEALDFCASLLSMKTGRPVKIINSREEETAFTRRRHPIIIHQRMGVKRDGTILAKHCRAILDGGAYNSWGPTTTILCGNLQLLPYRMPNLRYEGYRAYTNKPPGGAMRGHGAPQMHFATELQLDMIAADLGLDQAEIRAKNALRAGDENPNGFIILSSAFPQCIEGVAQALREKETRAPSSADRGLGIGCSGFVSGSGFVIRPTSAAFTSAWIRIGEDGTATLLTGAADTGQGSDTVLAQIAAEELGLSLKDITVISGDTGITPYDMGNYSSRTTVMAGNAVRAATADLRRRLFQAAADKLEAKVEDLEAREGSIYVKGSPQRGIAFSQAVALTQAAQGGQPLIGQGSYNPPRRISPAFSFGAQGAEVAVDRQTGEIKVLSIVSGHDCGRAINPMAVEGQLEGSIHMGMGFAAFEELLEEKGQILNPSFLGYRLPTALEMPAIRMTPVESIDPEGPLGAKEAGEGTVGPTAPAIANAVYNAVGVRIKSLPLTPEKILEALEGKDSQRQL